jgi:hypothetical protein
MGALGQRLAGQVAGAALLLEPGREAFQGSLSAHFSPEWCQQWCDFFGLTLPAGPGTLGAQTAETLCWRYNHEHA